MVINITQCNILHVAGFSDTHKMTKLLIPTYFVTSSATIGSDVTMKLSRDLVENESKFTLIARLIVSFYK